MNRSIALALGSVAALLDPDAPDRSGGGIPDPKDEGTSGTESTTGGGTTTETAPPIVDPENDDFDLASLAKVVHNARTLRAQLDAVENACALNPGMASVLNTVVYSDNDEGARTPVQVMDDVEQFAADLVITARRVLALKLADGVRAPMKAGAQTRHLNGPRSVAALIGVEKQDKKFVRAFLQGE